MTVSEICKIMSRCDKLRNIMLWDSRKLTDSEIQEICELLRDYRDELLNKEIK